MYKRPRLEANTDDASASASAKRIKTAPVKPTDTSISMEEITEHKIYTAHEVQCLLNKQEKKLKQFYETLMEDKQQEFALLLEERIHEQYTMYIRYTNEIKPIKFTPTHLSYIS